MTTGLGEGRLWIETMCRTREGWAPPGYSCQRHATWVTPRRPCYVTGPVNEICTQENLKLNF